MTAGIKPYELNLKIALNMSTILIFSFQIAEPNCGIAFGKPHMYYKSSKFDIPPAMITF